jgi:ribonuclease-3 family protein
MHGDYMNVNEINVLVLAYLGDSVYENYIRKYLINTGIGNVNDLQSESIKYVSAKAQAKYMDQLINNNILNDEELNVFKRARNYKTTSHPKNTDIITYKIATGFEAVIGYLEFINNKERIEEIIKYIVGE